MWPAAGARSSSRSAPRIRHEAVLADQGWSGGAIRVEVLGSQGTATRPPLSDGYVFSPRIYPVTVRGQVDEAHGLVRGELETAMRRSWNRLAIPVVAGKR